jgi:hypothetical protein
VPFISEFHRTIIDSLVGGQEPEDLCINDNDTSLDSCKLLHDNCFSSEYCTSVTINNTSYVDQFDKVIFHNADNLQNNCVSGPCSFVEDKIMYYCVNDCIHNRFNCNCLKNGPGNNIFSC